MGFRVQAEALPHFGAQEVGGEPQLLALRKLEVRYPEGRDTAVINGADKIFDALTSQGNRAPFIASGVAPVTARLYSGPEKTFHRDLMDDYAMHGSSLHLVTLPHTTQHFTAQYSSWLTERALRNVATTPEEAHDVIDRGEADYYIDGYRENLYDKKAGIFVGKAAVGALFDRAAQQDPSAIGRGVRNSFRAILLSAGVDFTSAPDTITTLRTLDTNIRVDTFLDLYFHGKTSAAIKGRFAKFAELIGYDLGTPELAKLIKERLVSQPTVAAEVNYQNPTAKNLGEKRLTRLVDALALPEDKAASYREELQEAVENSPHYIGVTPRPDGTTHHLDFASL